MTLDEFKESLTADTPPKTVAPLLAALWWDAKGHWDAAHRLAQDIEDEHGSWVHAYLHRKEGDASNAGYWYRRARHPPSHASLEDEWDEITTALLSHDG